jgi:hypothetical protein
VGHPLVGLLLLFLLLLLLLLSNVLLFPVLCRDVGSGGGGMRLRLSPLPMRARERERERERKKDGSSSGDVGARSPMFLPYQISLIPQSDRSSGHQNRKESTDKEKT